MNLRRDKAIVFDRDGTLIKHVHYLFDPAYVELQSDTIEAIELARGHDITLIVHTNQSGVGRGMFSMDDVQRVNSKMLDLIGKGPDVFTRICIAPENPEEPSLYRKPSTRLVEEIEMNYGISRKDVVYVGDRVIDLETAYRSGTKGVGVATGLVDIRDEIKSMPHLNQFRIETTLLRAVQCAIEQLWLAASDRS
jgi:D-glycero-D-manno-heptose 1,7-bisphosphate phosphatase